MWHEIIHTDRDMEQLVAPASVQLPGFEEPPAIVCFRAAGARNSSANVIEREFWAEEAGRAAAVSHAALARTDPFRELMALGRRTDGPVRAAWPLLYDSAKAIGVNSNALVKQLSLEGRIVIQDRDVFVQRELPQK